MIIQLSLFSPLTLLMLMLMLISLVFKRRFKRRFHVSIPTVPNRDDRSEFFISFRFCVCVCVRADSMKNPTQIHLVVFISMGQG